MMKASLRLLYVVTLCNNYLHSWIQDTSPSSQSLPAPYTNLKLYTCVLLPYGYNSVYQALHISPTYPIAHSISSLIYLDYMTACVEYVGNGVIYGCWS